jgi:hypothetical protein
LSVSKYVEEIVKTAVELRIGVTNGTNGGIDRKAGRFRKFPIV